MASPRSQKMEVVEKEVVGEKTVGQVWLVDKAPHKQARFGTSTEAALIILPLDIKCKSCTKVMTCSPRPREETRSNADEYNCKVIIW